MSLSSSFEMMLHRDSPLAGDILIRGVSSKAGILIPNVRLTKMLLDVLSVVIPTASSSFLMHILSL